MDHTSQPGGAAPLTTRFGSAKHPGRPAAHARPDGVSDDLVEALGRLGEAAEIVEHARGHLYAFHRLSGRADLTLQDAVRALRHAGATELADDLDGCLVGRDVVAGMWTFQLVEAYDREYRDVFRAAEEHARSTVASTQVQPHLLEAEMKQREQQG